MKRVIWAVLEQRQGSNSLLTRRNDTSFNPCLRLHPGCVDVKVAWWDIHHSEGFLKSCVGIGVDSEYM